MRSGTARRALVVVLLLCMAPTQARADTAARRDESLEGTTFLDIDEISHGHRSGDLVHSLSTHQSWDADDLDNKSRIVFKFNLDSDGAAERILRVDSDGKGGLIAVMSSGGGRRLGTVKTNRPDDRSVRVSFPRRLLRKGLERYVWRATTIAHGCDNPDTELDPIANSMRCFDYAPNREPGMTHRL